MISTHLLEYVNNFRYIEGDFIQEQKGFSIYIQNKIQYIRFIRGYITSEQLLTAHILYTYYRLNFYMN